MAKAWKIAPGRGAKYWDMCLKQRCIVIGWLEQRDFRDFKSEKEILEALGGKPGDGKGAAKSIWRFLHEVQPSHVVIANKGKSSVVGIGVVESEYLAPGSPGNPSLDKSHSHARRVNWVIDQPIDLHQKIFAISTIQRLKPEQCKQIKQAYLKESPQL